MHGYRNNYVEGNVPRQGLQQMVRQGPGQGFHPLILENVNQMPQFALVAAIRITRVEAAASRAAQPTHAIFIQGMGAKKRSPAPLATAFGGKGVDAIQAVRTHRNGVEVGKRVAAEAAVVRKNGRKNLSRNYRDCIRREPKTQAMGSTVEDSPPPETTAIAYFRHEISPASKHGFPQFGNSSVTICLPWLLIT